MRTPLVAVAAIAAASAAAQEADWSYTIDFDNGNFLGGSADRTFFSDELDGPFVPVSRNFDNGISVNIGSYGFDIALVNDAEPVPGFYPGATRWPFQVFTPGLAANTPGRGYNMLEGEFTIFDVAFDDQGDVIRFDIDFELAGDSDLVAGEFFRGSFRYVVPAPASASLLGAAGLIAMRRRR